jgi:hypothetical protein
MILIVAAVCANAGAAMSAHASNIRNGRIKVRMVQCRFRTVAS